MKTVIGIDPGLASLGWGVLAYDVSSSTNKGLSVWHVAHGVISTDSSLDLPQRLLKLDREFDKVLSRFQVQELAYEQQFFVKNVTSGIPVAHALGVILLYCATHTIPVSSYTPLEVKKQITGNARASKQTISKFMAFTLRLNLDSIKIHHASDAMAIALTHILQKMSSTPLQKSTLRGLKKKKYGT